MKTLTRTYTMLMRQALVGVETTINLVRFSKSSQITLILMNIFRPRIGSKGTFGRAIYLSNKRVFVGR